MDREDGSISLEVRWILPGPLPHAMIDWIGPFAGEVEDQRTGTSSTLHATTSVKIGVPCSDLKAFRGQGKS